MSEHETQNAIMRYLATCDLVFWRQNTGVATFHGRTVRFGVPGQADISGIMPDGKRLEIEVKTAKGRQSTAQKNYAAMIARNNGVYILARSAGDVFAGLEYRGYGVPKPEAVSRD